MNWESLYLPPDPLLWQGHLDAPPQSYFYQHIHLMDLLSQTPQKTAPITFAILGFKCDEGAKRDLGRPGAIEGPAAIRKRLARLPVQKPDIHCYDVGNIVCTNHDLEKSQQALAEVIATLLAQNIKVIILGGGHELAFGHYQGIKTIYPPEKKIGIINFDAHFGLHPLAPSYRGSAKTTFYQIAKMHQVEKRHLDYNCIGIQHAGNIHQLFELAKEFKTQFILADDLHQGLQEKCF